MLLVVRESIEIVFSKTNVEREALIMYEYLCYENTKAHKLFPHSFISANK